MTLIISEFIERDSPFYAEQVVERIVDLASELPANPRLGRMVPELHDLNVRERFV